MEGINHNPCAQMVCCDVLSCFCSDYKRSAAKRTWLHKSRYVISYMHSTALPLMGSRARMLAWFVTHRSRFYKLDVGSVVIHARVPNMALKHCNTKQSRPFLVFQLAGEQPLSSTTLDIIVCVGVVAKRNRPQMTHRIRPGRLCFCPCKFGFTPADWVRVFPQYTHTRNPWKKG